MHSFAAFHGSQRVPPPTNEAPRSYAPGTPERASLKARLTAMAAEEIEIPLVVGGQAVRGGSTANAVMPHDHHHVLAAYHKATPELVQRAVDAAVTAHRDWSRWPFSARAGIFLRAAELLTTTWRDTLNAATMLGQSKTAFQAE